MASPTVLIKWTATAEKGLRALPPKVQRGLIAKVDELLSSDPTAVYKPLIGALQGLRSIKFSRYRALYSCSEELDEDGTRVLTVTVSMVAVGLRKEGDKKDIYNLAERLVALGLIRP